MFTEKIFATFTGFVNADPAEVGVGIFAVLVDADGTQIGQVSDKRVQVTFLDNAQSIQNKGTQIVRDELDKPLVPIVWLNAKGIL